MPAHASRDNSRVPTPSLHPPPPPPPRRAGKPGGGTVCRAVLLACTVLALGAPALASASPKKESSRWALCPGWDAGGDSPGQRYEAFFSPHTHHWTYSEEHRQVVNVSLSRRLPNERFCGLSLFTNSFGQPSAYAFVGKSWPGLFPRLPNVYASVSAGIIYGYVDEFEDKVPLNFGGFSPAIIPAVGLRLSPRASVEVHILGTAALMFGTTLRF